MDAFWSRVEKRNEDECWPWRPKPHKSGYGQFKHRGGTYKAHRVAFALTVGGIEWSTGESGSRGALVLHKCDNRRCCNPAHLFLGGQDANIKDAATKQRMAHGEEHVLAKLTVAQVVEIKKLWRAGLIAHRQGRGWHRTSHPRISLRSLGVLCGVSGKTIEQLLSGRAWKGVGDKEGT